MGSKRDRGKFGLRIRSYQAGSVYAYNNGVRDQYDYKDAMLTNSMFLNYMKEHGLNIHNGYTTRDIISVDFNYGSRSYEQETAHLQKMLKSLEKDKDLSEEQKNKKKAWINERLEFADNNREKYDKKSAEEIRTIYYNDGFDIEYVHYNRSKTRIVDEVIHYKMLYRTPGKAKKGSCMFCREELWQVAHDYLWMGIELPDENAPIVEIGAYSSLITSTIDINIGDHGRIKIAPEEILILKDVDAFFNRDIISIEIDENKHCYAKEIKDYPVMNEIFDGQSLIDSSIFPKEGNGYILLRQHFTKSAAFCTHIQKYFKDYYGDKYEDAYIEDMFGRKVKASNIKLITTNNSVKWLKFPITFDMWADKIREADNYWGIVKTAHESKFGDVQRMSYQMVNALDIDSIEDVCQISLDYISDLKNNDEVFLQYLRDNSNFSNDFDVLLALVNQDPEFIRCEYFRYRRSRIINTYATNFKTGKVMQNGDNLVIAGNVFGMLMHSVGEDPLNDPTFQQEEGTIQCWTNRFEDGEYLAEFRSPFNSRQNLGYLHNVYDYRFDEYFELGNLCIVINMIHTDFQSRNNGSDQDSDSIYVTNSEPIIKHAKYCYLNCHTIVNNVPQDKNIYSSSMSDFAKVDNKLAASQLSIGMSSNLAQVALSYSNSLTDKKYMDAVCILSVLAQLSIDSTKRTYDIDIMEEIKRLRDVIDVDHNKYPEFWLGIRKGFNKKRINKSIDCPMSRLYKIQLPIYKYKTSSLPMSVFFNKYELNEQARKSRKIEKMINDYAFNVRDAGQKFAEDSDDDSFLLLRDDFDQLVSDLRSTYISKNYLGFMSYLLDRAFSITHGAKRHKKTMMSKLYHNRTVLTKVLYEVNPENFLRCFSKNV